MAMEKRKLRALVLFISSVLCSAAAVPSCATPRPSIPKTAPPNPFCPRDTVKLGVCMDILGDIGGLIIGAPPRTKCCALLEGLTDAEAALCLCTTIKESVLGITTEWSVALSVLVSACKKDIPDGFKCV
ncbi:hypothetical protein Cni_G02906 [Canna indica]|uniref:Bifunctional inhibitor/plant lipid transfer protein/seed storage helical domain-containing protein n=1 Tax=Canna indica TaxID=4628 RepID=A0AAQ3JQ38_9LILI|nr:hypothetical protein Cni_G02906 [Canna indica]